MNLFQRVVFCIQLPLNHFRPNLKCSLLRGICNKSSRLAIGVLKATPVPQGLVASENLSTLVVWDYHTKASRFQEAEKCLRGHKWPRKMARPLVFDLSIVQGKNHCTLKWRWCFKSLERFAIHLNFKLLNNPKCIGCKQVSTFKIRYFQKLLLGRLKMSNSLVAFLERNWISKSLKIWSIWSSELNRYLF